MPAPRGVFALLVSLLLATATIAATMPPGLPTATTSWPPSDGLVLAEVMTGGASASDEYVEIANSGTAAVDLGSCELVYVTASGSTVTRKALFSAPLPLAPGSTCSWPTRPAYTVPSPMRLTRAGWRPMGERSPCATSMAR